MEEDTEIADMSQNVECIKIALTQDKNGFILKLALHPNDTPEDLLRDPVGQRYTVVFVRVNDQGQPVASPGADEGIKAVRLAGTLCTDPDFQMWMAQEGYASEPTTEAATEGMRIYLGVVSRRELRTDADARSALARLRDAFVADYRAR
jgi:hypothetical protein